MLLKCCRVHAATACCPCCYCRVYAAYAVHAATAAAMKLYTVSAAYYYKYYYSATWSQQQEQQQQQLQSPVDRLLLEAGKNLPTLTSYFYPISFQNPGKKFKIDPKKKIGSKKTWFLKLSTNTWTRGPDLSEARWDLTCG